MGLGINLRPFQVLIRIYYMPLGFRLHSRTGIYQIESVFAGHRVNCEEGGACALNALLVLPMLNRGHYRGGLGLTDLKNRPEIFAFPFGKNLLLHDAVGFLDTHSSVSAAISLLPWRFG